jgi:hypothetical protein
MFLVVAIAQQLSDGTITPFTSGSGIEGAAITAMAPCQTNCSRSSGNPDPTPASALLHDKLTKLSVDPTRGLQASTIR